MRSLSLGRWPCGARGRWEGISKVMNDEEIVEAK